MSRSFRGALKIDLRELFASRAFWLMLLAVSVLVGQTFTLAVSLFAEASGVGGGPAALSQGLSPLEGILVPTFGAYDLAATLLFPFVVIRIFSEDRRTGAHWLTLQAPMTFGWSTASKAMVAYVAWLIAFIPALVSLVLWKEIGGHLYAPETIGLLFGYILRGVLTIGIGAVAAAVAESASSAAVLALSFTIGTWALDYFAAAKGGWVTEVAEFTPWAALRTFERGEIRLETILVLLISSCAGVALAAITAPSGRTRPSTIGRSTIVVAMTLVFGTLSLTLNRSWDVSESRRNSFAVADATALSQLSQPLAIEIHLAPEDPRLVDLEHGVLAKLERTVPHVHVTYTSRSRSGLFEGSDEHYGEVWYSMGAKRAMTRSSIEEVVLETIYGVAGITPPAHGAENAYTGFPQRAHSAAAPWVFFLALPALISLAWFGSRRREVRTQNGEPL